VVWVLFLDNVDHASRNHYQGHGFPIVARGRKRIGQSKETIRPDRCPEKNGRGRAFTPFAVQPIEEGQVRMNTPRITPDPTAPYGEKIHFDHFEISWAGENPQTGELCFGSDEGRFRMRGEEGPSGPICPSGEAVNGIAFSGQAMAMSTRCDVALIQFGDDGDPHGAIYDGGAHDVIAASSGGFVAPLGVHGILTMKPTPGPKQLLAKWKPVGNRINFYKFVNCTGDGEVDLIVGACRDDGLAIIEFDSLGDRIKPRQTRFAQLPGLDLIDVCSLRSPEWPRAVACLGSDRTIYLSRDVLDERPAKSLRIGKVSGKAYSLLHDRGHLFLLTTDGFYIFPDLAAKFLSGNLDSGEIRVLAHHSKSIDEIYIAYNSLLLSIGGDIDCMPIDSIVPKVDRSGWSSGSERNPEVVEISWKKTIGPDWSSESKIESAA
jgi:hypothetical protein